MITAFYALLRRLKLKFLYEDYLKCKRNPPNKSSKINAGCCHSNTSAPDGIYALSLINKYWKYRLKMLTSLRDNLEIETKMC